MCHGTHVGSFDRRQSSGRNRRLWNCFWGADCEVPSYVPVSPLFFCAEFVNVNLLDSLEMLAIT